MEGVFLKQICFEPSHPNFARTPRPIVDGQDRIIAALAGQPNDPQWDGVSDGAAKDIHNVGEACSFTAKQEKHRRGSFPALAVGVSFGGGQQISFYRLNLTAPVLTHHI
jgi:hypothetical protein